MPACVRWFQGSVSREEPGKVDKGIFRENTEDIRRVEVEDGIPGSEDDHVLQEMGQPRSQEIRDDSGIGIKPVSREGTERLVRAALEYAIANGRRSVTLVHKGNIMKYTEGAFRDWGYELVKREYTGRAIGWDDCGGKPPEGQILVWDNIADITLQQALTGQTSSMIVNDEPNGDYLSDALAAQVGGIGIAPGGNINYETGHAVFEATHGTAPKYAGARQGVPWFVAASGVLMLERPWLAGAADHIVRALEATIADKVVTYDFARVMDGATEVKGLGVRAAIVDRL